MSRPIVCGVDLAMKGDRAAACAAALARELGCESVLVHAQPVTGQGHSLRELQALADRHGFPHGARGHLATGDPAEALTRMAEQTNAEMTVIAGRGLHELAIALLGGVSSTLVRTAPCPIAVLPPEASVPAGGIRAVVAGIAGGQQDGELLSFAADLARRLSATLHVVHAFHPRPLSPGGAGVAPPLSTELHDAAEATLAAALAKSDVQAQGHLIGLPPVAALERIAEEQGAGLIVVGSRGRGRLGSLLHGSTTIRLAAEATIPVIVLPPTAQVTAGSGHYEVASDAA